MHDDVRAALCERFPKLRPVAAEAGRTVFVGRWFVPLSASMLWPSLADTSRVNRSLGVPTASFLEVDGHRRGSSTYFGFEVAWDEPPWEWVREQHFVLTKEFSRGPVRRLAVAVHLDPATHEGMRGTWVSVLYAFVPRGVLGSLVVPWMVRYTRRGYEALIGELLAWARTGAQPEASPFYRPRRSRPLTDHTLQIRAALVDAGFEDAVVDRFLEWVLTADPLDLTRIRVRPLAAAWGLGWQRLLELALEGTRVGLLVLTWDVVCPHCRGVRLEAPRLSIIPARQPCEVCQTDFATDEPGNIELTFRVHAGIRDVQPRLYCSSDAATKPHIEVQLTLAPGTWRDTRPLLPEGRYVARTGDFAVHHAVEVRHGGASTLALSTATAPSAAPDVVAPRSWLTFHNESDAPVRWVLETIARDGSHVAPGDVLSLVRYRDLLGDRRGDDAVPRGVALEMGSQTLLFADVVGSTELYLRQGDHRAFQTLTRHLDRVVQHVREHEGVVVKTMGDTVMASFAVPDQALAAARAIQAASATSATSAGQDAVSMRISLHQGPCLAVDLDTGLDYFGATVNIAAMLLRIVGPGEIGLSSELAEAVGAEGRSASLRVDATWLGAVIVAGRASRGATTQPSLPPV